MSMFALQEVYLIYIFRKKCYFVDLFVRVSNTVAVNMYKKMGYSIYRVILGYYSGDVPEDAYDVNLIVT